MSGERQFRVLVTAGAFAPGFLAGGPIRSLTQMVDTLPDDVTVDLVTRDRDHGANNPYPGLGGTWQDRGRSHIFYLDTRSASQWRALIAHLRSRSYDWLYVNSLFSPIFSLVFMALFFVRLIPARKLLIAPRGELSPGALAQSPRKKQFLLPLLYRVLDRRDVLWHATATMEADDIRAHFPAAQIVVNANQSSLPPEPLPPLSTPMDEVRLVFLSRISPKKNLEMAVRALAGISTAVSLDVFGPLEDTEYWAGCQAAARKLPPNVTVTYQGPVAPDEVQTTFRHYDAFLFPTLGENFGYVIAESLSSSCPVLCSDRTPWTELLEAGGGRIFRDMSFTGLQEMLRDFCHQNPEQRIEARRRAGVAYQHYRRSAQDEPHLFDALRRTESNA